MPDISIADLVARTCAAHGVRRAFGVPGGGSSLDLIAAFARHGIGFVLCRTETGATLAAAADAELRHGFGVSLATQGPGTASAMNGLAHALLDRAPVLFISDGWTRERAAYDTHQVFDQQRMSSAVAKATSRLESDDPARELDQVIASMLAPPWGPAHIVLTSENARRTVSASTAVALDVPSSAAIDWRGEPAARLSQARRPVMLVGLEARQRGAATRIKQMAHRLNCPVLTTYKAKGIVPDDADHLVGHVTGGAAEYECIAEADLIILCGFDPVELIGKPWPYQAPVLDIGLAPHPVHYVEPQDAAYGPLCASLDALLPACQPSTWTADRIAELRAGMRDRLRYTGHGVGLSPQEVVEVALATTAGTAVGITVDAGAHMFSAMGFWQARHAGSALISNGLATMAFALPAGIARALHRPDEATLVFTGDGGLMMCAGELATAAQARARLCVIVFNDASLSLIELKQRGRGMERTGVDFGQVDYASVARGFGLKGFTARDPHEYEAALRQALAADGPCLIDVRVDPSGYIDQAKALRG
jgi:acetolactate synthase-1/2/3 large subunit